LEVVMKVERLLLVVLLLAVACSDMTVNEAPEIEGDEPGEYSDGTDNDQDGLTDCDDDSCAADADCAGDERIGPIRGVMLTLLS